MTTKAKVTWDADEVCLVTGGAGFIGSYLVRELVSQGKKVVALDFTPNVSYIADCLDKVTYVYGTVADMPQLMDVVTKYGVGYIFHLGYMLVPDTENLLSTAIQVNCNGFHNVMEAARIAKVKRVIWASTQSVYGLAKSYPPGPLNEDVFVQPETLYGACKLFNEHVARHYWNVYGLENIGLRKTVVYGLGKSRRRDKSIFHVVVENALLGRALEPPPVDYYANYVYVKDVVRAYLLAARAPRPQHLIFNIGGQVLRNSEVVELMKKLVPGVTIRQQQDHGLPHPIEAYQQDMTRAKEELGYEPVYTLEEGIRDYLVVKEQFGGQYEAP